MTPCLFPRAGPCITNVFATCRKNFSQWHRSFQRKLRSYWLTLLRHVAITLVIQDPGPQYHALRTAETYIHDMHNAEEYIYKKLRAFVGNCAIEHLCHISNARIFIDSECNIMIQTNRDWEWQHMHHKTISFPNYDLSLLFSCIIIFLWMTCIIIMNRFVNYAYHSVWTKFYTGLVLLQRKFTYVFDPY